MIFVKVLIVTIIYLNRITKKLIFNFTRRLAFNILHMKKLLSSARFVALYMLVIIAESNYAQIYINEFLASNTSVNVDPDYNSNADWIELFNAGTSAVNLNGYYLTDNFDDPSKWKIAQNISIPAKGFLIIWTDGNNTGLHTSFKISSMGEEIGLYSPSLNLLDSITFGEQNIDISFGRSPNGSNTWKYFLTPTPGTSNNTNAYAGISYNFPHYSVPGGLYNSSQSVVLSTDLGGTIRYTLDGSDPATSSTVYSSPIQISSTTIVRSRIFKPNEIPGPIITNSYFINENFESGNLPVVSITTNPENFWDPAKGIYVQDFKPEWEVPVNIELFENNGSKGSAVNLPAGIKINGLYSWQLPQKMLGIYFKKQYGAGSMDYHLFFEKDRKSFKDFALRASGSDWSYTMFRDGLMHMAIGYNMNLDYMSFRPSVVYVNGQYMGIHNMREKVDEDFIMGNHKTEKGSIDMIEYEEFAEAGDITAYIEFKNLYSQDLSIQSNYDKVAAVMDIENFTDYIITELYSGNYSIEHNVMTWKPKGSGKWKWILMDLDRGLFDANNYLIGTYLNKNVWPFPNLFENEDYKQYFGKRLASHLFTTFNKTRMLQRIDYHRQLIESEIPNHVARWLGTTSSYGNAMPSVDYWYQQLEVLRTFVKNRPAAILNNMGYYGFSGPATLTLSTSPADAGKFEFNDMKVPEASWNGLYPKNMSFSIKAINKPGYVFKGWKNSVGQSTYLSTDQTYSSSLTGNLSLVAVYESTGQCIIPDTISTNTTLNKACSPYLVQGDINIPENITLTIEPGVEIWMAPSSNMTINGNIIANGTEDERIIFKINPDYAGQCWGALNIIDATDTTVMDYVTVEDASHGPVTITQVTAISAFKSDLVLNHMILEKNYADPVAVRYGYLSISNSTLHSEIVGNLINVVNGFAKIENCEMTGNKCPDTDAVDFDDVDNGVIRNCRVKNFTGSNSDGLDLGQAVVTTIDSVTFFNITDKGISVGLQSKLNVSNCAFVNTNLGLGLKDSSSANINHCTFYGVGTPVACYEKIRGRAGGNAFVKNSILSNSYTASFTSDDKSTIKIYNSLSDNTFLPENGTNQLANPLFTNPTFYDFTTQSGSPVRNAANDNGIFSDLGSNYIIFNASPRVMISKIYYNSSNNPARSEFIGIYNPSTEPIDLSGYKLTNGVIYTFPQGVILDPGYTVLVAKWEIGGLPENYVHQSYQWTEGSLSNEGETIQLTDSSGIVIDQVSYSPNAPWPSVDGGDEKVLSLLDPSLDNHFGENWTTVEYNPLVTGVHESFTHNLSIYPNPTNGLITLEFTKDKPENIEIYSITGLLVKKVPVYNLESITIDLSAYKGEILILKADTMLQKIVVLDK